MASSIETHPQRQQIIDGIIAGKTLRDIAAKTEPKVSAAAIQRYRAKVVTPTLKKANDLVTAVECIARGEKPAISIEPKDATRVSLAAQPILNRIAKHQATIDAEVAAAAGDGKTVAALINADYKGMDLQGKLTGAIDAQPGVTLNVAQMLVLPRNEATAAVQGEVIDVEPGRS